MDKNYFEDNNIIENMDLFDESHDSEHTHSHEDLHEHIHGDAHLHEQSCGDTHSHDHSHVSGVAHAHFHSAEEKKRQINRLAKVIGHLQHVKLMIENDADCADVLMQLSASKSALNGLGKEIINEHISHCIYHAIEDGDEAALEEFQKAIKKFF